MAETQVANESRSVVSDSAIPWTVIHQVPVSMEFSRQEHWSGLPFPSPGYLPNPGIEPRSPALQVYHLRHHGSPRLSMTNPKAPQQSVLQVKCK